MHRFDTNLPGKLTQHEGGRGWGAVERRICVALVAYLLADAAQHLGKAAQDANEIPMAVIFAEIAKALIRIEEQILRPAERVVFFFALHLTILKTDHL